MMKEKGRTPAPPREGRGKQGRASGPVWPILQRLLGYMKPHARMLFGVLIAMLATTAIELAPPVADPLFRGWLDPGRSPRTHLVASSGIVGDLVGSGSHRLCAPLSGGLHRSADCF